MHAFARPNARLQIARLAPFWIVCVLLGACAGSGVPTTQPKTAGEARAIVAEWGIESEYPFAHRFLNVPHGRMHYVDEGKGSPILAVHGQPTWSFLYRHVIRGLSDRHRVVAPDLVGFGLSEKPTEVEDYTIEGHADDVEALLLQLDLREVTLVVHDWGGPIGLGAAARHPDRIRAIVVLNTMGFYPPTADAKIPFALRFIRAPGVGELLLRRFGMFERTIMPTAVAKRDRYEAVQSAYRGPFASARDRAGVLAFPRLIPDDADHPSARLIEDHVELFLEAFDGPVLILWGEQDPFFSREILDGWKELFPEARVIPLPDAAHYVQEDAHEEIVPAIRTLLDSADSSVEAGSARSAGAAVDHD
ncbi:MAG: alpha/beta fold hydrolase [Myxococcota bacterium]